MDTYLLIKYLKCSTTPEDEAQVRRWLADDPGGSHAKQYSDAHFLYEGMVLHSTPEAREHVRRPGRFRKIWGWTASVAAAAAMVFVAGLWSRNNALDELSAKMETIYVPAGKCMNITLEDGTQVWLNSGTELEYPVVFSRRSRNVKVNSGEALFDVARDEKRPFEVDTYASTISVLGTKFNVSVDEGTGDFSAALLRGSIKVTSKFRDGEECVLRPNQLVTMEDEHLVVGRIDDPESVGCWTNGLIDLVGVPFDNLMRKFELAYDMDIVIERETLPEIRYTRGKVRISDGVEHALSMLALVSDFSYEYDRQTETVYIR